MLEETLATRAIARIDIPSISIPMICTRFSVLNLFMPKVYVMHSY